MALDLNNLSQAILAVGALGLAAFGLVDGTKAFWGGVSRVGFGRIAAALRPFSPALDEAVGKDNWKTMLIAHWLNGRPVDEQKAIARSMVRMGLTPAAVASPALAQAGHVEQAALVQAATKLAQGAELTPVDLNVLGRLDASVDMALDAAYERADQQYRNTARVLAGVFAVGLSFVAMAGLKADHTPRDWLVALLVGVLAVPISPIAKDLASTLQSAAKAVSAIKG